MIANFYHVFSRYNHKLIGSKNLEVMPSNGDYVTLSGQVFRIHRVVLDMDRCEYNVYVCRP